MALGQARLLYVPKNCKDLAREFPGREFLQMTDWLAQGRFALCMGCKDVDRARQQGFLVASMDEVVWKEGRSFSSAGGTLSFVNRAPHPNAAKVFINWQLSRKRPDGVAKHE